MKKTSVDFQICTVNWICQFLVSNIELVEVIWLFYSWTDKSDQQLSRRVERNAREQRRSKRITNQISHLREILRSAGRPVKSNKASVLSETADFIRDLQKQKRRLEVNFHFNDQIRFMWPQARQQAQYRFPALTSQPSSPPSLVHGQDRAVSRHGYCLAFYESGIPMAVATMDGCFVDCNQKFIDVSSYSKEELLKLTVFNLTAPQDLQDTFTQVWIKQIISFFYALNISCGS